MEINPPSVASLPNDIIIDIMSRVPYRSLCRFKCVSRSWLALCSDPDICKRSPQTLSGFFCHAKDTQHPRYQRPTFLNLSGRGRPLVDPSLPFLHNYDGSEIIDCSGGLVLCRCYSISELNIDYVVCNPATKKWTVLPNTEVLNPAKYPTIHLCFDPVISSRFEVFVHEENQFDRSITGAVEIYSSETREWTSLHSQLHGTTFLVQNYPSCVFFNGTMHLIAYHYDADGYSLVRVDSGGTIWRKISMPHESYYGSIGQSQGRLYIMQIVGQGSILSVWFLDDYVSGHWTLEHTANISDLLGRDPQHKSLYAVIAIHPEQNLIFFIDKVGDTLLSYDMDDRKVKIICSIEDYYHALFAPYIPCFAEWL